MRILINTSAPALAVCILATCSHMTSASGSSKAPVDDERSLASKTLFRHNFRHPIISFNAFVISALSRQNKVGDHYQPVADDAKITPIHIEQLYPGTGDNAFLSDGYPKSEDPGFFMKASAPVGLQLKRVLSLGFNYGSFFDGTGVPWTKRWEKKKALPKRPLDFMPTADAVAGVLTRGPFSVHTVIEPDTGDLILDLSSFDHLEPREPFVPCGGIARVEKDPATGSFKTKSIKFDGKEYLPGSNGYPMAQKRFLVALNSFATLIDHLTYCHILGAQNNALAIFGALPNDHHLRILMQPFISETTKVNTQLIPGLINFSTSNVPSYTGYPLKDVKSKMKSEIEAFDVKYLDPLQRYEMHGMPTDDEDFPTIKSTADIYKMYLSLAEEWLAEFMKDGVDEHTKNYVQQLEEHTPNGIFPLVGIDSIAELEPKHVARIIATLMFTGSVWHHNVNDKTGPYFFTNDIMPTAIAENGLPTWGVVMEKRNSIVAASKYIYYVLPRKDGPGKDKKSIGDVYSANKAISEEGNAIWTKFEQKLIKYSEEINRKPDDIKEFLIEPYDITSSIHA